MPRDVSSVIQVSVHSEADLYSRYDPTGSRLNKDLYDYIKTCYNEISLVKRREAIIQLKSERTIDSLRVMRAILDAVQRDIVEIDKQISINKMKMIRLYIIGLVLIIAGVTLSLTLDQVALEILSIIGSMAIKDGATIMIQNNPELRIRKRLLEEMKQAEIEVR